MHAYTLHACLLLDFVNFFTNGVGLRTNKKRAESSLSVECSHGFAFVEEHCYPVIFLKVVRFDLVNVSIVKHYDVIVVILCVAFIGLFYYCAMLCCYTYSLQVDAVTTCVQRDDDGDDNPQHLLALSFCYCVGVYYFIAMFLYEIADTARIQILSVTQSVVESVSLCLVIECASVGLCHSVYLSLPYIHSIHLDRSMRQAFCVTRLAKLRDCVGNIYTCMQAVAMHACLPACGNASQRAAVL